MKLKFLIDEQLSPGLAEKLVAAGFDAQHFCALGLGEGADMRIWRHAARINAVIITKDEDFAILARTSTLAASVLWIRIGNVTTAAIWRRLEPLLPEIVSALKNGERLIEIRSGAL